MKPLNVTEDFLEALQYSPFHLHEFLVHKQQESGWSKEAYLKAMELEIQKYRMDLKLLRDKAKSKKQDIDKADIGIPLEKITGGKVKEYYTFRTHGKTKLLNAHVLETFASRIEKARTYNEPQPVFSNLQILSFTEKALEFILNEFKVQTGIEKSNPFFRNTPKDFKQATDDGRPVHLIYNYLVSIPTPVFDYHLFEDRFRELVLNCRNLEKLAKLATPLYKAGKEIVNHWNESLAPLEEITDETVVKTHRPISFNTGKRNFTIYTDLEPFVWNNYKPFTNYQLTVYAANVGHLIASELPEIDRGFDDKVFEVNETKPAVASYAIMHVYWGKYDKSKAITKTNKKVYADKYAISEITFFDFYGKFYEKKNRLSLPTGKKEQKNSVVPFIKKFEEAASMLEDVCTPAYEEIKNDIDFLKMKYQAQLG